MLNSLLCKLNSEMEKLRFEMYELSKTYDLTSTEVVTKSEQIDQIHNRIMQIKKPTA